MSNAMWRLLIALAMTVGLAACSSDGGDADGDANTPAEPVSDADSVVNEIPQNVLLTAELVDGALVVTNAGNVTMSDITVESSASSCTIGTLAPDATGECAGVSNDWSVSGQGPQGQPAQIASSS